MAWTTATFKARYPEFAEVDAGLVAACLADALAQCGGSDKGATAWGGMLDQAVGLKAAHMIAISPAGMGLQLHQRRRDPERNDTTDVGSTSYEQQYLLIRRARFAGVTVSG